MLAMVNRAKKVPRNMVKDDLWGKVPDQWPWFKRCMKGILIGVNDPNGTKKHGYGGIIRKGSVRIKWGQRRNSDP
jgi:hypothetical protein